MVFEPRNKSLTRTYPRKIGERRRDNIKHKEYESTSRIRHPYARIVHNVKLTNGKWSTQKCYLGKLTNVYENLSEVKETLDPKIKDMVWNKFKEVLDGEEFHNLYDLDPAAAQVVIALSEFNKSVYPRIIDTTEITHFCPHCSKPIKIKLDRSRGLSLKEWDSS